MGSDGLDGGMKATALELFAGLASSYERALDLATVLQDRHWKRWAAEMSGVEKGSNVLDIGCGTLLLEERHLQGGCCVVGLDLTLEMIKVGQTKRLPNVRLMVNGDAEHLPFADGFFDVVVSCYVAKYVDVGIFSRELARVVRPGGRVVVYDFARPQGSMLLPLEVYIHGPIRLAGAILGLTKKRTAFTFENIPQIVDGAVWDTRFVARMEEQGFETLAFKRLSPGVVSAYAGRMPIR